MISFNFISKPVYTVFTFNKSTIKDWIIEVIKSEYKKTGNIIFNFCTDEYLLLMNKKHLNHNYYTDIISFDYSEKNIITGEIFISMDRVYDNSYILNTSKQDELLRVIAHGVLHFCGYKDKTSAESITMRFKEDEKIKMYYQNYVSRET